MRSKHAISRLTRRLDSLPAGADPEARIAKRLATAFMRTVGAVGELSGGDRQVTTWALLLLFRDVCTALMSTDDDTAVTAAMAAATADPAALLERARAEWPTGEVLRELRAIHPRWEPEYVARPGRVTPLWGWPRTGPIPRVPPRLNTELRTR